MIKLNGYDCSKYYWDGNRSYSNYCEIRLNLKWKKFCGIIAKNTSIKLPGSSTAPVTSCSACTLLEKCCFHSKALGKGKCLGPLLLKAMLGIRYRNF